MSGIDAAASDKHLTHANTSATASAFAGDTIGTP
jgi:hypothetical protein